MAIVKLVVLSLVGSGVLGVPAADYASGRLVTQAVDTAPILATTRLANVPKEEDITRNAPYSFGYSVADTVSGVSKTREETRGDDGVVRGSYSVADPDGRIRVVTYTADAINGFQAKVTYDGEEGPVAIPFNAPVVTAARTLNTGVLHHAAPVLTSTPVFHNIAAPVAASVSPVVQTVARTPSSSYAAPAQRTETVSTPVVETTRVASNSYKAPAEQQTAKSASNSYLSPEVTAVRTNTVQQPEELHTTPVVTAVRQVPEATHAVHTVHTAPVVTAVRQVPEATHAVHTVHTAPAVTAVRQVPDATHAVHTVHTAPVVTAARQVPTVHAVHNVHTAPVVTSVPHVAHAVHSVQAAPVFSAVRQFPEATHTVHAAPVVNSVPNAFHAVHATPVVTSVRQIPNAVHAVHAAPAVTAFQPGVQAVRTAVPLGSPVFNSGVDLSQFRFVGPANVAQN